MGGESRVHSEEREKEEDNEVVLHQLTVLCHLNMFNCIDYVVMKQYSLVDISKHIQHVVSTKGYLVCHILHFATIQS